jgi:hypothetical protein
VNLIGYPINLAIRLQGLETNKFVRATIFADDLLEISGSPVLLTHLSGGTYVDNSLVWPDTKTLFVNFDVFDDALLTIITPGEASFQKLDLAQMGLERVDLSIRIEEDAMLKAKIVQEGVMKAVVVPQSEVEEVINIIEGTRAIVTDATNGSGSAQPAFKVWAWKDDNTVDLADAADFDLADLAGVNVDPVDDGDVVEFIRAGRAVGALAGRGFLAGTVIYLSETPGDLTDVAPSLPSVKVIIGQAEPTNPNDTGPANDLYVQPQLIG